MSIYKKQSDDLKTFETPEEFLKFYENNKKDIDETKTRSLNLKYKIKGHHIGRKENKLILYPIRIVNEPEETTDQKNSDIQELEVKFNKLKDVVVELIERVNYLETHTPKTFGSSGFK